MKFDSVQFLKDNFGEPLNLLRFLQAYRIKDAPKRDTIYHWWSRDAAPSRWVLVLLAYLEIEHGAPVSIQRYLK